MMVEGLFALAATVVFVSALGIATNALDALMAWWERNR